MNMAEAVSNEALLLFLHGWIWCATYQFNRYASEISGKHVFYPWNVIGTPIVGYVPLNILRLTWPSPQYASQWLARN